MIERLHVVNFKSHADTTITPGRLTALVGPNGAGKTGVLQALDLITRVRCAAGRALIRARPSRRGYA